MVYELKTGSQRFWVVYSFDSFFYFKLYKILLTKEDFSTLYLLIMIIGKSYKIILEKIACKSTQRPTIYNYMKMPN